ncbi:MAG: DUF1697 domain-containing protein [Chloroflexota bacterium]
MAGSPRRYVALLRAINVGGNTLVRMADLRARFEAFGATDVVTYIQSGNVIFTSPETDAERLARGLERHLQSSLGYHGTLFVFTGEQLRQAAAGNPFEPARMDKEQRCHLLFMSREPEPARQQALLGMRGEEYRFAVRDKVLYYAYSRAFDGRRRSIDFEKVLGVVGTARGWNVVDKLIELTT